MKASVMIFLAVAGVASGFSKFISSHRMSTARAASVFDFTVQVLFSMIVLCHLTQMEYNGIFQDVAGKDVPLSSYKDKKAILIVNVASK